MSSWKECKLGDIAEIRTGKSNAQDSILNGIYPLFDRSQTIKQSNRFLFDDEAIIVAGEGKEFTPRYFNGKFDLHQRAYAVHKITKAVPKFIFYAIWSNKEYFESVAVGSTVMSLRLNHFTEFPLLLPPLEEQKAIAEVLSSLDDKIDLLHRQNQTLESLAQTLFRQWFIEEAKEEWEEVLITDLFEVRDGTHDSPKQKEFGKKLLTSKHILKNKLDFESSYFISEEDFEKINQRSIVEQGDILFSMIGTIGLTYLEQSNEIDYAIKNIGLFKTSQNKKFMYFVYLWLNSSFGAEFIHENRSGSTQEYISLGSLRNIIFNLPNYKIIDLFNEKIEPIFEKINTNMKQIQTLENLRDTLLPKLLSGEVRMKR